MCDSCGYISMTSLFDQLTRCCLIVLQRCSGHHTSRTGRPQSWRRHGCCRGWATLDIAAGQCAWRCVPVDNTQDVQSPATKDSDHTRAIAAWWPSSSYRAAVCVAGTVDRCDRDVHSFSHATLTVSTTSTNHSTLMCSSSEIMFVIRRSAHRSAGTATASVLTVCLSVPSKNEGYSQHY